MSVFSRTIRVLLVGTCLCAGMTAAFAAGDQRSPNNHVMVAGAWTAIPLPLAGKGPAPYPSHSKHMRFVAGPKRIYVVGGDFGGADHFGSSARQEIWSLDLTNPAAGWTLEKPYCVPDGQVQPGSTDEYAVAYDTKRKVIWGVGGGQPFSNPCPGEDNDWKGYIMYFDPATGQWTNTNVKLSPEAGSGTVAIYDQATDTIWKFGYDFRGQVAWVIDAKTLEYRVIELATNNSGERITDNNSRLTKSSMAFDPEKRRIWTVSPNMHALMYLDMDAEGLVVVRKNFPHTTGAAGPGMLFFNRDNGLLYYFDELGLSEGWFDFYVYDPKTDRLVKQTLPTEFTPRGNSGVYDPYHDKIMVIGSSFVEVGKEATHYFVLDLNRYEPDLGSSAEPVTLAPAPRDGHGAGWDWLPAAMPALASEPEPAPQLDPVGFRWHYMNPVPSLRYKAIWADQQATFALTPEDRIETREPWFREYSFPVAGEGRILYFGGGHGGYAGNEVAVYRIAENKWVQLSKPVVPPKGDPLYGSGGSDNVYVDPATGEWQPYTIHGYGRISYLPPENMLVATIMACSEVVQTAGEFTCGSKNFYLAGFDLDDMHWHTLGNPLVESTYQSAGSLSEYDPVNDAIYIFGGGFDTMVWKYHAGTVTRLPNLNMHVGGGSGHGGAASTYIPPLEKHLVAEMPQGGSPPAGLYLVDFEASQATKITVPTEIASRFGPDGNFYFDYNDRLGRVVVLQGGKAAGESFLTLYDPATDTWGETQHFLSGPTVRTVGANNRKPLVYDEQTGRMFYVNYNGKDGVETWELVLCSECAQNLGMSRRH